MTEPKIVSVVLGSYNRAEFLKLTLDSIRRELEEIPHEIIVVDGGSTDGGIGWLVEQKDVVTIVQHNRGVWQGKPIERRSWGYFMNLGFKAAQGKFVCMLSDDCLVVPGAIRNGIALFEQELEKGRKVGAVAFYWRDWPKDKMYKVGLTLGDKMFVNHGLYLRRALEEVDYCDEENYLFYHGDSDLCLKMWERGYEVIDSPESRIEHYADATPSIRVSNFVQQDWANCLAKWSGKFYDAELQNIGKWVERAFEERQDVTEAFDRLCRSRSGEVIQKSKTDIPGRMAVVGKAVRGVVREVASCSRPVGELAGGPVQTENSSASSKSERNLLAHVLRRVIPRALLNIIWRLRHRGETTGSVPLSGLHLHLGRGDLYLPGYVNIAFPPAPSDLRAPCRADRYTDLRELEYPDGAVAEIRLHHIFESFDRGTAIRLLADWYSWLKEGGRVIIEVADFERCAAAWVRSKNPAHRMRLLRHIFGSHEGDRTTPRDGWYQEKFERHLSVMGFSDFTFERYSRHGVHNLVVFARKLRPFKTPGEQLVAAEQLLRLNMADDSDAEQRALAVWMGRLKG